MIGFRKIEVLIIIAFYLVIIVGLALTFIYESQPEIGTALTCERIDNITVCIER